MHPIKEYYYFDHCTFLKAEQAQYVTKQMPWLVVQLTRLTSEGSKGRNQLIWELKYRRGLEGLKSSFYSKLNKKEILAPPIPFDFVAFKLTVVSLPFLGLGPAPRR
jgi:hypothetical protein